MPCFITYVSFIIVVLNFFFSFGQFLGWERNKESWDSFIGPYSSSGSDRSKWLYKIFSGYSLGGKDYETNFYFIFSLVYVFYVFSYIFFFQTTFINSIDAPSLALLVPIVHRGLRERGAETKKKAAQIVGNMCSLVTEPNDMIPYIGLLLPEVKKVSICKSVRFDFWLTTIFADYFFSTKTGSCGSNSRS